MTRSDLMKALLVGVPSVIAIATPAFAESRNFNIPAGDLKTALKTYIQQSSVQLIFRAEDVRDKSTAGAKGQLPVEDALDQILAGTGLSATRDPSGAVMLGKGGSGDAADASDEITVTGSRIRGAPIASPVIVLDHQAMVERGQTSTGDVMRSLPQDFGGGQNPGIGIRVPAAGGINVGGASTANLRGLGSDATLTLLNGHHLAYNASRQGIDLSSIPFDMIDRVEVVADGASALYGSDAVAGVVNVILRRDYEGLQASANLGAATDGGDFQQQYGLLAGHKWSSGGIVVAYEYSHNTDILSTQRSFTAVRPGIVIYPAIRHHAVALSLHQALTSALTFEMDAIFNRRWDNTGVTLNNDGNWAVSHQESLDTSRSVAVAPSLKWQIGEDWRLTLSGVYGTETVRYHQKAYSGSTVTSSADVCYCNAGKSVELAADGRLFDLPAGPVKLAAGVGYRVNSMNYFAGSTAPNNFDGSQSSTYAYGEISIPVVSPAQDIAAIDHINLSGAVRYERYPGIGSVATPKLGIIYAPVADVSIKGSWGRSFRAPTLYQQHQGLGTSVYTASSRGGVGYPSTATVLSLFGGNVNLKPERAESWAATMDYTPHRLPGLRFQASYFSTIYKDRVVTPITYSAQSLSNPLYASWVDFSPTSAAITSAITNKAFFTNYVGATFDPSKVVAIIYNGNINAGRQTIHGLDLLVNYKTDLGQGAGHLGMSGDVAYLVSRQQLIPGAAITDMAGTLYNPPHWRGNASLIWGKGRLTLNTVTTVIGGVTDVRTATPIRLRGMVTQDVTARYTFGTTAGLLHGLALSLTVQNLLNEKPPAIATSVFYDVAFDSTNYSATGRYIGMGVTKSW